MAERGWTKASGGVGAELDATVDATSRSASTGGSISMKMHSPGQASAAWITCWTTRSGTRASEPEPRIVEHLTGSPDVGDAVLELRNTSWQ